MRGKKTSTEDIYKIMVSYFSTGNFSETARDLDMPITTVENVYKANENDLKFVKLRTKKEDEFVIKASRIIDKGIKRIEKELDDEEKYIPINHLTTAVGTMYDKRALATGDSTENQTINVKLDKQLEDWGD